MVTHDYLINRLYIKTAGELEFYSKGKIKVHLKGDVKVIEYSGDKPNVWNELLYKQIKISTLEAMEQILNKNI